MSRTTRIGFCRAELGLDRRDQGLVLAHEIEACRHEKKRHVLIGRKAVLDAEGRGAGVKAGGAFKGAIDDRALQREAITILPAKCDMQGGVESPKGLAAFRRAPDCDQANARQHVLDQVI